MSRLIEEIRINPSYVQHLKSEFQDGDTSQDSTPIIRKTVQSTPDYLKKISAGFDVNQGILPPNCRYVEKLTNGTLVVIEEPPAYRTIKVNYSMNRELSILKNDGKIEEWGIDEKYYSNTSNAPFSFTLAFPYVIHLLVFDKYDSFMQGQVFLRNARLAGYSDYLLKIPMMNISSEGFVCYGDKAGGKRGSLSAGVENVIMVFWSAIFNSDYTYNYSAYKDVAGVNTYIGWQALSQIDPMFIYNVQWIKMERNLKEEIDRMKQYSDLRARSSIAYGELTKIFTQPADTGNEERIRRKSSNSRTARLYYDVAQGIYLNENFFFHVGDAFKWGKHIAHVDSFIGFFESDQIRILRLTLDHGKTIHVRFNRSVRDYILKETKEMRFESQGVMKNGTVVKENDIISLKIGSEHAYRKIHFIRKAKDGVTEARIGNAFYVLENTEGEVLDLKAPVYNGMEINKSDTYIIIPDTGHDLPFHSGDEVKYDSIGVSSAGRLNLEFISTDTDRTKNRVYKINMGSIGSSHRDNYQCLLNKNECISMPEIFRVGRKLICMRKNGALEVNHAWGTPNGIVYNRDYEISVPTIGEIENLLLSKDGTSLNIKSYDLDINFNIGDKVVYADWKNPVNMLITRTITAFTIDKAEQALYFILADKDGNLTRVEYISGTRPGSSSNRPGIINIGRIRKITNKFGRVTAGTKIKAKKGYITHFPKKDVNIIIGFITDTGGDDPLVLCSNCCTLWYSDMMENFSRITIKSKRWPTLAHAPIDITKIKYQLGDIVNGDVDYNLRGGWMVMKTSRYRTATKIGTLEKYTSSLDMYTFDKYTQNHMSLDCIPNPRISPTEQGKLEDCFAYPNFHGLFIENKLSSMKFLDDGRSLLHVQSSHK